MTTLILIGNHSYTLKSKTTVARVAIAITPHFSHDSKAGKYMLLAST